MAPNSSTPQIQEGSGHTNLVVGDILGSTVTEGVGFSAYLTPSGCQREPLNIHYSPPGPVLQHQHLVDHFTRYTGHESPTLLDSGALSRLPPATQVINPIPLGAYYTWSPVGTPCPKSGQPWPMLVGTSQTTSILSHFHEDINGHPIQRDDAFSILFIEYNVL